MGTTQSLTSKKETGKSTDSQWPQADNSCSVVQLRSPDEHRICIWMMIIWAATAPILWWVCHGVCVGFWSVFFVCGCMLARSNENPRSEWLETWHSSNPRHSIEAYRFLWVQKMKVSGLGLGLLSWDKKLCQYVAGVTIYNSLWKIHPIYIGTHLHLCRMHFVLGLLSLKKISQKCLRFFLCRMFWTVTVWLLIALGWYAEFGFMAEMAGF